MKTIKLALFTLFTLNLSASMELLDSWSTYDKSVAEKTLNVFIAKKRVGPQAFGITPLMLATYYDLKEQINKLIELGSQIDAKAASGETALEIARQSGSEETVKLLESKLKAS